MNITEAWDIGYSGRGIKIAIVDDGLQTNHTDLDSNVVCIFLVKMFVELLCYQHPCCNYVL
jgi:tetraacyldisaccharide-1-P 4'-kinase